MNPEDYHLEFYDDGQNLPVKDWLEDLEESEPAKHDAIVYALSQILARQGTNVCETEFGKTLGRGLYEFRLRHTRDELQAKTQPHLPSPAEGSDPTKVLLRVFFAVYGDKIVLLLGGYDKGKDPTQRRQNNEIAVARKRLKDHQSRLAAEAKAAARGASAAGGTASGGRPREVDPTTRAEQRVPAGRSFLLWFRKRRQKRARGVDGRRR